MMRCVAIVVLIVGGALGIPGVAQGVIEGTFDEHALARVGSDTFAVGQGRSVEIRSWASPNRVTQSLRGADAFVVSLASSPDGRLLAAGDKDGHLMVWEISSGRLLFKKYAHRFSVWSVAFSPDGMLLASGAFDGTVRLWDTKTWTEVGLFIEPRLVDAENKDRAHMGWVRCVTFSPDGRTLATSGCDGYVRIWDVDTLRLRREAIQAGINVYFVTFSPDGQYLGCVTNPGEIRLYRTDTWEEAVRLRSERVSGAGASSLYAMAFSPDGTRIVVGGFSKKVEVWDVASRTMVAEYAGHTDSIWGIIVFPDGERVVTTSRDNTVRLWRIAR
ncbi:WD40 repeat domain-containing protein [Candidatus Bipolaricaulota bacterium]|nr:WD40 repeat domain-containing protein [Candidatus Bipolaricaulota bacterium]